MQKGDEVKGSFRTRKEGVDLNLLAKKFGGGGHKKASGFVLENAHVTADILNWEGKTYSPEEFANFLLSV